MGPKLSRVLYEFQFAEVRERSNGKTGEGKQTWEAFLLRWLGSSGDEKGRNTECSRKAGDSKQRKSQGNPPVESIITEKDSLKNTRKGLAGGIEDQKKSRQGDGRAGPFW